MIYFDTCYLLKLYAFEPGSAELVKWLTGKSGLVCSHHGRLELISALKRHEREGRLEARGFRQSMRRLKADEADGLIEWLPVNQPLIDEACEQVAAMSPQVFLRAADALHLVCAKEAGLKEIYSYDRHLLTAAPHFGLKGRDVIKPV